MEGLPNIYPGIYEREHGEIQGQIVKVDLRIPNDDSSYLVSSLNKRESKRTRKKQQKKKAKKNSKQASKRKISEKIVYHYT